MTCSRLRDSSHGGRRAEARCMRSAFITAWRIVPITGSQHCMPSVQHMTMQAGACPAPGPGPPDLLPAVDKPALYNWVRRIVAPPLPSLLQTELHRVQFRVGVLVPQHLTQDHHPSVLSTLQ